MLELNSYAVSSLSLDEMVDVNGGEESKPRSFGYRVGQAAAEVAEFFVGVWDGLTGK